MTDKLEVGQFRIWKDELLQITDITSYVIRYRVLKGSTELSVGYMSPEFLRKHSLAATKLHKRLMGMTDNG